MGLQGLSPHTLLARNSLTPLLRGLGAPGECGRDGAGWMWSVSTWKTDTCHCSQGVLCEVTACLYPQLLPGGIQGAVVHVPEAFVGKSGYIKKVVCARKLCVFVCVHVCVCVCLHAYAWTRHTPPGRSMADEPLAQPWALGQR